MHRRLLNFLFIGGVAFWLDAALFFLSGKLFMHIIGHQSPPLQKVFGFAVGVSTTYFYNSLITFSAPLRWKRFCGYFGSQLLGMIINLASFLTLQQFIPALPSLALATVVATFANFLGAKLTLNTSNMQQKHWISYSGVKRH